jgi:hypothetical protein
MNLYFSQAVLNAQQVQFWRAKPSAWGMGDLRVEVPKRGPGAEPLVGVWGQPPEAERLSRF